MGGGIFMKIRPHVVSLLVFELLMVLLVIATYVALK